MARMSNRIRVANVAFLCQRELQSSRTRYKCRTHRRKEPTAHPPQRPVGTTSCTQQHSASLSMGLMQSAQQPRRRPGVVLLVLLANAAALQLAAGQGLSAPKGSMASSQIYASQAAKQYAAALNQASSLSRVYNGLAAGARSSCLKSSGASKAAGCAGLSSVLSEDSLALATAPQVFSWHPAPPGQQSPFGPVGNQQDCFSCVAYAVAAAAEAAVARTLNLPGGSVSISEQDLNYCKTSDLRFCRSPWDTVSALRTLTQSVPVTKACLPSSITSKDTFADACTYKCKSSDSNAAAGRFIPGQVNSYSSIQRQIRVYGSVISRINLFADFKSFFQNNPTGIYDGASCSKGNSDGLVEEHAVLLVGYNNIEGYWVARNSWGPDFADQGHFRIKYGACGVAAPGDSYGVAFAPTTPNKPSRTMSPDPEVKGCYVVRAKQGDFLGMLAEQWGVDSMELLANNTASITDLNAPLAGKFLSVCKPGMEGITLPDWVAPSTPAAAAAAPAAPAPRPSTSPAGSAVPPAAPAGSDGIVDPSLPPEVLAQTAGGASGGARPPAPAAAAPAAADFDDPSLPPEVRARTSGGGVPAASAAPAAAGSVDPSLPPEVLARTSAGSSSMGDSVYTPAAAPQVVQAAAASVPAPMPAPAARPGLLGGWVPLLGASSGGSNTRGINLPFGRRLLR